MQLLHRGKRVHREKRNECEGFRNENKIHNQQYELTPHLASLAAWTIAGQGWTNPMETVNLRVHEIRPILDREHWHDAVKRRGLRFSRKCRRFLVGSTGESEWSWLGKSFSLIYIPTTKRHPICHLANELTVRVRVYVYVWVQDIERA